MSRDRSATVLISWSKEASIFLRKLSAYRFVLILASLERGRSPHVEKAILSRIVFSCANFSVVLTYAPHQTKTLGSRSRCSSFSRLSSVAPGFSHGSCSFGMTSDSCCGGREFSICTKRAISVPKMRKIGLWMDVENVVAPSAIGAN